MGKGTDIKEQNQVVEFYTGENKFSKSNFLIGAKFKSTLLENKLMAMSLAQIDKAYEDAAGALIVTMKGSEIRNTLKISSNNFYNQLEKTASRMAGRVIGMSNPEKKEFHFAAVVTNCSYKDGLFKIEFNKSLNKYLRDLQANFTKLSLQTMLNFKSVYSFRLYEVLKSKMYTPRGKVNREGVYKIEINIHELKYELGVYNAEVGKAKLVLMDSLNPDYEKAERVAEEKSFTKWADFKRSVIDVAINEINATTEIEVNYDTIKSGRGGKVTQIDFYVKLKDVIDKEQDLENSIENSKVALTEDEKLELLDDILKLFKEDIRIRDAKAILEASEYDFEKIKDKYQQSKDKTIDNIVGWMIIALREDFGEIKGKNQYQSFNQREYNFDELEKQITQN